MHQEDIDRLVNILASQATNHPTTPQLFFKDLVDRADLPTHWKQSVAGIWTGDARRDSRTLIQFFLNKGVNPNNTKFTPLGSILQEVLLDIGTDIRKTIANIIVQYRLYLDETLLEAIIKENSLERRVTDYLDLKKEVDPVPKIAISDLTQLLELILSKTNNFNIIKRACQRSLPRRSREKVVGVGEIEKIIGLLIKDFKLRKDSIPRVFEFVIRLTENDIIRNQNLHLHLINWLDKYNSFKELKIHHSQKIEPRLSIIISPCQSKIGEFFVQAWLRPDDVLDDPFDCYKLNFSFIELDEISENLESAELIEKIKKQKLSGRASQEISFALDEVRELLNLFVVESLNILLDIEIDNEIIFDDKFPVVEFFLPSDLLLSNVDQWKFCDMNDDEIKSIGHRYPVLIRSQERLAWTSILKNAQVRNRKIRQHELKMQLWRSNWERVKEKLEAIWDEQAFVFLDQLENFDKDEFKDQFSNLIGVTLACPLTDSVTNEFLKLIIRDTLVPIALCTRYSNPSSQYVEEIKRLLQAGTLNQLPQSIRKKRFDARKEPNQLGNYLVLLWDNPNCLPPSE